MKKMKHLMLFENYCIIGRVETVTITNENGDIVTREAKIDTASKSTRICKDIAAELKLPVVDNKKVWNELGEEERTFVELQININGVEVKTVAGITDMSDISVDIIIGYRDIETINGIIDVNKTPDTLMEDLPMEDLPMEDIEGEEVPLELPVEELEDGEISKTGFCIEGEIERKNENVSINEDVEITDEETEGAEQIEGVDEFCNRYRLKDGRVIDVDPTGKYKLVNENKD